jgi:hypothetical protein
MIADHCLPFNVFPFHFHFHFHFHNRYVDANGNARRMRMPSTLSSDLVVDLRDYKKSVDVGDFELPSQCDNATVGAWDKVGGVGVDSAGKHAYIHVACGAVQAAYI